MGFRFPEPVDRVGFPESVIMIGAPTLLSTIILTSLTTALVAPPGAFGLAFAFGLGFGTPGVGPAAALGLGFGTPGVGPAAPPAAKEALAEATSARTASLEEPEEPAAAAPFEAAALPIDEEAAPFGEEAGALPIDEEALPIDEEVPRMAFTFGTKTGTIVPLFVPKVKAILALNASLALPPSLTQSTVLPPHRNFCWVSCVRRIFPRPGASPGRSELPSTCFDKS